MEDYNSSFPADYSNVFRFYPRGYRKRRTVLNLGGVEVIRGRFCALSSDFSTLCDTFGPRFLIDLLDYWIFTAIFMPQTILEDPIDYAPNNIVLQYSHLNLQPVSQRPEPFIPKQDGYVGESFPIVLSRHNALYWGRGRFVPGLEL